MSTCDIVYVVDLSAFKSSCASTYDVVAFGVSKLSVSVFVYVVYWFAFSANAVSTCVIVYVVAVSACIDRAAVMSAVLLFRSSGASTYDVVAFGTSRLSVSVLVYVVT